MATILWFKRDLRVVDHPALALAAEGGEPILPLYIIEPEMWAQPDASARQWRFVAECLAQLQSDLAALGAPLILRHGPAVEVLEALRSAYGVTRIVSHEETGTAWSFTRDQQVAAWAKARSVLWQELPQSGVVRRLRNRDGWAQTRERWMRQHVCAVPKGLNTLNVPSERLPDAREIGLPWDPCPGRQKGGRASGLDLLDSFLTARAQHYRRGMSAPGQGATACSRLSPHLAWGSLSAREVQHATAARKVEVRGTDLGKALHSFTSRLAWRDHFIQKLEDAPDLDQRCLHSAYETLRPKVPDATRLAAWEAGQTGVPFVDACMRSLNQTGWLNFRMRAMLVAVASYHLWLDWRSTGPHLARMFTDYEPGIHWSQCQMQSGTTGINTLRIYNPIKQGQDHDPSGAFTRKWVPELSDVPTAYLQTPWQWDGAERVLGHRYPRPVVDPVLSARAARDRVWAVRKSDAFGREANYILRKHASRAGGGFVNDRTPRKRDDRQMSFDL